jgi:hypothetical protein
MEKRVQRRVVESLAILMIGDGFLTAIQPRRHVLLWKGGPRFWRDFMKAFLRRPGLTQVLGATAVGLGLWLARVSNLVSIDFVTVHLTSPCHDLLLC